MSRIIFDIETDGLLDDLTVVWCIVCRDVDTGEVKTFGPDQVHAGVDYLFTQDEIIGHNIINFDLPALRKRYGDQFQARHEGKFIDRALPKLTDTLVLSRLMHTNLAEDDRVGNLKEEVLPSKMVGSHGLKAWGYRLGYHKGEYLEEHGFDHFSEAMMAYCVQDTEVTYHLYQSLVGAKWEEGCITLEHKFAACMQLMERHGFCFDAPAARNLYVTLSCRKLALSEKLKEIFPDDKQEMKSTPWRTDDGILFETKKAAKAAGYKEKEIVKGPNKIKTIPFNPGSRDHISARLGRLGWVPKEFTTEGKPKVDEKVLSGIKLANDNGAVDLLNEYLLLVKRMGMLAEGGQAWLKAERGGRMHGRINTNGAVTGRCTHSTPNMAQVPGVGSPYGKECRSLFKASPGYTLVGCDASGLELRCLAHYLAPYDKGDYTEKILKRDIHVENQKAAGLPSRDAAKTFIYAFLYGAGDSKVGEVIGKGRAAGKLIKETFLRSLPALAKLKACITAKLEGRDHLKGLDGRHLYVRSEHAALNTLLQAAGAVVMKQATVHLYENLEQKGLRHGVDWAFVAHVHDEFQLEVLPDHVATVQEEAVNAIRQTTETLQFRCPLDGESRAGKNWSETH